MQLILYEQTRVKEIKKRFASSFPFLKLEFFRHNHRDQQSSFMEEKVSDGTLLAAATPYFKQGIFSFEPSMSVSEFEQRMQDEHGLPVQVFRKSGNIWLETIQTDNLELQEQNTMGEESSKTVRFNINTLFL